VLTAESLKTAITLAADEAVRRRASGPAPGANLPAPVLQHLVNVIAGGSDPSRLVALTQLAAKAASAEFDARCLQAQSGAAIDLRSAYKVAVCPVVTALADHHKVSYRPSQDPYVSNQFREAAIDDEWVTRRRFKEAADLKAVLDYVEATPSGANEALVAAMAGLLDFFDAAQIDMTPPRRIHVRGAGDLVLGFLSSDVGDRLERVVTALMRFIGKVTGKWDQVEGHQTNDPAPYDCLCYSGPKAVAAAQSKAKAFGVADLKQLVEVMTQRQLEKGYFFTDRETYRNIDQEGVAAFQLQRLVYGQRVDVHVIDDALAGWLSLADTDEQALPEFLTLLGEELRARSPVHTQRAWAECLKGL
jgi:hypothetical protein